MCLGVIGTIGKCEMKILAKLYMTYTASDHYFVDTRIGLGLLVHWNENIHFLEELFQTILVAAVH